jgi:hypothetical protein
MGPLIQTPLPLLADDRSVGRALSAARDHRRGPGAHLFRGARAPALQDQASGAASCTAAAPRSAPAVVAADRSTGWNARHSAA